MRHPDDLEPTLLARAREGDPDAFTALLDRHDRGLRALAFRLLGDRERMDDALQEAYLRAFRALPSFRSASAFGTWLYRIAYNACLDDLRRAHDAVPLRPGDVDARAGELPDPADSVSGREDVARALAALAPIDRAALLLVDAQGMDYASAAEVLGVPTGTVASRLNRARRTLRGLLSEEMEGASRR